MDVTVAERNPKAVAFAFLMRQAMERKGVGTRDLARVAQSRTPHMSVETWRRVVARYRAGDVYPVESSRQFMADCLGVDVEELSVPDEDETNAPAFALLEGHLYQRVQRVVKRHEAHA